MRIYIQRATHMIVVHVSPVLSFTDNPSLVSFPDFRHCRCQDLGASCKSTFVGKNVVWQAVRIYTTKLT